MVDPHIARFQAQAESIVKFLHSEFSKLQTGRANAALIEHIDVDAYGQKVELRTIAGISVTDARTMVIQPWDRSVLGAVEKALLQAKLGTAPVNDGTVLRINLPPMTEERRRDLAKVVQKLSEDGRISIRKARQEAHDAIKSEKDEDVRETLQKELQKVVEIANAKIAESAKMKEEEVMKV